MKLENTPYFPPLYGDVKCENCDKADCMSRGKYQRNRRDFTYTSGRCPRLPDRRGFVEKSERELQAAAFPLIHAERGSEDSLCLTLTIPGAKRSRRAYYAKTGHCYFRDKHEAGFAIKRVLTVEECWSERDILDHMERANTDYCVFRCTIEDYYL